MPDWPAVPLFLLLFVVVLLRAGATYAIGRGVRGLADRRGRLTDRPAVRRVERVVETYGPLAVVLCFLTVGVQTAVNAAAGSLRMPLRRYIPALVAGGAVWATIYVTVGAAAIEAVWAGQWAYLVVALVALGVLAWLVHRWFERRSVSREHSEDGTHDTAA